MCKPYFNLHTQKLLKILKKQTFIRSVLKNLSTFDNKSNLKVWELLTSSKILILKSIKAIKKLVENHQNYLWNFSVKFFLTPRPVGGRGAGRGDPEVIDDLRRG
jgi:hypothetical protein